MKFEALYYFMYYLIGQREVRHIHIMGRLEVSSL
jgi:hypothetical protein